MRINEVERCVGIAKKNIRFYEEEGLLKPSRNAENGYREYSPEDVAALKRIRLLRQLAVPLDDIRRLQEGTLTLDDCMQRQVGHLEHEARNLMQVRAACAELAQLHEGLSELDVDACERRIAELESTGTRFMSVKNDITRRLVGPAVITAVVSVLMLLLELLLWQALAARQLPLPAVLVLCLIPAAVAGGLIASLWMRVREVRGGEEDEASQY